MGTLRKQFILRFTVTFEGPALRETTIDADILGEFLLGIHNLLRCSNEEINGSDCGIQVKVDSGFHPGSFGCNIIAGMPPLQEDEGNNIVNLLIFGTRNQSLFHFLKKTKGRSISDAKNISGEKYLIHVDGLKKGMVVSSRIVNLYININVRQYAEQTLSPLFENKGITAIQFSLDTKTPVIIKRKNIQFFKSPVSMEDYGEGDFTILQPNHDGRPTGWILALDPSGKGNGLRAHILDWPFLRGVKYGFFPCNPGDHMRAVYHRKQYAKGYGTTEWELKEILAYNDMPLKPGVSS